jgi:hypothetical protein
MASYLHTLFFYCDRTLARSKTFDKEEISALLQQPYSLRAASRRGHTADCIAAVVAAQGADRATLDFISGEPHGPPQWPEGMTASVLPFEELITIAQSIDSLLAWSATSTSVVSRIWQFNSPDEIQEALKSPVISPDPNNMSGGLDSDGYTAEFLFAFLASIASVVRDAHASERGLICFRAFG